MISIIIPTLNEESVLEKTLANLKTIKTISNELIISDGRSQDKTIGIAKKFTDKIVIYDKKERQTIGNARNLGAKIAQGEYLVFIDADTAIPNPDHFFSEALKFFEQDEKLAAITVPMRVSEELETFSDRLFFGLTNLSHRINNNITHTGSASGEFQMIRKYYFDKVSGFDDFLVTYEDNDLFERLAKIGETRLLTDLRIFHSGRRVHKVGHLKLLFIWVVNAIWFKLFRKAATKEWKPIR